ncbi:hypothetical protein [Streptomyces cyslabdanicus]|uniref:hypothetical protein n=1 Tax=Streptomyces cyslabdanicus TaxID=1470456 RepID=UPI0040444CC3
MAYGPHHNATPPPRPDLGLARDCEDCLGWGTVVTHDGRHELCATCQCDEEDDEPPVDTGAVSPRRVVHRPVRVVRRPSRS